MSVQQTNALSDWTPAQIALGKRWVETWRKAGIELERIKREELRALDTYRAIEMLCGVFDPVQLARLARPTSGLIEQQRLFKRAASRE